MYPLTVVMSTYNETRNELNDSIQSILNQSYSKFYFIIVDDNPQSKKLKYFLLKKCHEDNRIRLIFNRTNKGLVYSLNEAISKTHSRFVARMDADDISQRNRFICQIKFMRKYNLDFVFPNGKVIKNNKKGKSCYFYNYDIINQKLFRYIFSKYYNFAIHSGWMVKRFVYEELNGYRYVNAAEDFDFLLRALIKKYKLGYQSQVLIYRRERNNSITDSNLLNQFFSTYILQRYVKKTQFNKIMPMEKYIKIRNEVITKKNNDNYNIFLNIGRSLKNQFNFKMFLKLIYFVIVLPYADKCIINMIKMYIFKNHMINMIKKHHK